MPAYKELFMADPRKVVAKAIKDSMMGKPVSVYGPAMKLFCLLCKAVPHTVILGAMSPGAPGSRRKDRNTEKTGSRGEEGAEP